MELTHFQKENAEPPAREGAAGSKAAYTGRSVRGRYEEDDGDEDEERASAPRKRVLGDWSPPNTPREGAPPRGSTPTFSATVMDFGFGNVEAASSNEAAKNDKKEDEEKEEKTANGQKPNVKLDATPKSRIRMTTTTPKLDALRARNARAGASQEEPQPGPKAQLLDVAAVEDTFSALHEKKAAPTTTTTIRSSSSSNYKNNNNNNKNGSSSSNNNSNSNSSNNSSSNDLQQEVARARRELEATLAAVEALLAQTDECASDDDGKAAGGGIVGGKRGMSRSRSEAAVVAIDALRGRVFAITSRLQTFVKVETRTSGGDDDGRRGIGGGGGIGRTNSSSSSSSSSSILDRSGHSSGGGSSSSSSSSSSTKASSLDSGDGSGRSFSERLTAVLDAVDSAVMVALKRPFDYVTVRTGPVAEAAVTVAHHVLFIVRLISLLPAVALLVLVLGLVIHGRRMSSLHHPEQQPGKQEQLPSWQQQPTQPACGSAPLLVGGGRLCQDSRCLALDAANGALRVVQEVAVADATATAMPWLTAVVLWSSPPDRGATMMSRYSARLSCNGRTLEVIRINKIAAALRASTQPLRGLFSRRPRRRLSSGDKRKDHDEKTSAIAGQKIFAAAVGQLDTPTALAPFFVVSEEAAEE